MAANHWESLRLGFMVLRSDCAIDPPIEAAGRLTAIWSALPEPGNWRLSHWQAWDGLGVKERFTWHADEAAALLGYSGNGSGAISFWLDRVKRHAPEQYVRRVVGVGPDIPNRVYSVEILDICQLSADVCRICKAGAIRAGAQGTFSLQRRPIERPIRQTDSDKRANSEAPGWDRVEILFLSDERVQIFNGSKKETLNYAELGFADGRKDTPNQAWLTLRAMAEQNGIIKDGSATGAPWRKLEKRMQEIRKAIRKHFRATTDPLLFVKGTGYQARFKIGCGRSYDT
jgi:hypothetical protein